VDKPVKSSRNGLSQVLRAQEEDGPIHSCFVDPGYGLTVQECVRCGRGGCSVTLARPQVQVGTAVLLSPSRPEDEVLLPCGVVTTAPTPEDKVPQRGTASLFKVLSPSRREDEGRLLGTAPLCRMCCHSTRRRGSVPSSFPSRLSPRRRSSAASNRLVVATAVTKSTRPRNFRSLSREKK
jgi:hypothetical protein